MSNLRSVIRDGKSIGHLIVSGPRSFRAFNEDGRPIGLYQNEADATRAVYRYAKPIPVCED